MLYNTMISLQLITHTYLQQLVQAIQCAFASYSTGAASAWRLLLLLLLLLQDYKARARELHSTT